LTGPAEKKGRGDAQSPNKKKQKEEKGSRVRFAIEPGKRPFFLKGRCHRFPLKKRKKGNAIKTRQPMPRGTAESSALTTKKRILRPLRPGRKKNQRGSETDLAGRLRPKGKGGEKGKPLSRTEGEKKGRGKGGEALFAMGKKAGRRIREEKGDPATPIHDLSEKGRGGGGKRVFFLFVALRREGGKEGRKGVSLTSSRGGGKLAARASATIRRRGRRGKGRLSDRPA